jgi:3',5'-cyclic AMP phosphodiesterase CpdA
VTDHGRSVFAANGRLEAWSAGRTWMRRVTSLAAFLLAVSCGGDAPPIPSEPSPPGSSPLRAGADAVLVGAGDIAVCGSNASETTASLIDAIGGTVITLGDNTLFSGAAAEFRDCFGPSWGRHRFRMRPSPGNHEYETSGALPYFQYFGSSAGPPGLGYYSYDAGSWHVISLNSNVPADAASPQVRWLQEDLESSRAPCTLAYWHHPLFSSGQNGNNTYMRDVWRVLYASDVDVVVNGHDHSYERFAPIDADGRPDSRRGIREFVVGTGGGPLYRHPTVQPLSEVRASVYGVLKLVLHAAAYDWEFIPVTGASFRDAGSGACH